MFGLLGTITNPSTTYASTSGDGLFLFISNIFKLSAVIAGIILIIRIISAGYLYLSSQGDPKKFQQAGDTITQSILGMVIVASTFVLVWLIARFTGIDIINPTIYGP
ncbi:MAG: hypothetical protein WC069_05660 [Candidatus Shapirobacteria bacterium]